MISLSISLCKGLLWSQHTDEVALGGEKMELAGLLVASGGLPFNILRALKTSDMNLYILCYRSHLTMYYSGNC